MNASSTRWPLRHYGWIVARFLLFSGAVFLLWPALAPAYVALIGFLMRPLLLILGFDATLVERSATTLQFDVVHGAARGLVTPLSDMRPILLNMATLVGLFSGACLPPRRPALLSFLVAALLLVLFQSALGVFLVIVALPAFAENSTLATVGDLLFAARSFVPIVLWLWLDAGARGRLAALLTRVTAPAPRAAVPTAPRG